MSLKRQFKTSALKRQEGVWFDVTTNTDGSLCRVKLRRSGRGNKFWINAFRARTEGKDMENISAEEDEVITADVFVDACLVGWEHLQPEDDGVELPFTDENARKLLTDPDWVDLLKDWQTKSGDKKGYQDRVEAEAKN